MSVPAKRKTDRRALYTKQMIREAFLHLKRTHEFHAITVSALCREAQISRGTFYLHYKNTMDLLEEIVVDSFSKIKNLFSQISLSESDEKNCKAPFCIFLKENTALHSIFLDDSLSTYLVEKMLSCCEEQALGQFTENSTLSVAELESILYFQFSGCLAVTKKIFVCILMNGVKFRIVLILLLEMV